MKGPLAGICITELASRDCPMPLRLAIAFTGKIAAGLGARVLKAGREDDDPVRGIEPLSAFLDAGKPRVEPPALTDVLLCDGPAFEGRAIEARVRTVYAMFPRGSQVDPATASEFTVAASTGLLDLVGDPARQPLRMGGHQLAYACGLAAYGASVAALCTGRPEVVDVSLGDVGAWLNWKNIITASWSPAIRSRLGRDAEWQVVRCADGWVALVYLEADWPVLRDFVDDPRLADPRFDDRAERRRQARHIAQVVESAFLRHSRAGLKAMALAKRLPLGPVWSPAELEADLQNASRGFMARVDGRLLPQLPVLWNGERPAARAA